MALFRLFSRLKTLIFRILSITWLVAVYYVGLFIHAAMAWLYCIKSPFLYIFGISWWTFMDFYYEFYERIMILQGITLLRMKLMFHGDFPYVRNRRENCIIICNHQTEFDTYLMAAALEKTGNIASQRHVLKASVKWLPFVGFFLYYRGSVFIDRGRVDWKAFDDSCQRLLKENIPLCLLIYPEGTIMNWALESRDVRERSRSLAREEGREPFQYVLFPKHRGFTRLLSQFRSRVDAVYDMTFIYEATRAADGQRRTAPGLHDLLKAAFTTAHIYLDRVDITDVPRDEEAIKQFLVNRLSAKERFLEAFYRTGSLPDKGERMPAQSLWYNFRSLVVCVAAGYLAFSRLGMIILPIFVGVPAILLYLLAIYWDYQSARAR